MEVPLEISYRGVDKTTAVESYVRQSVKKLERFCDHLVSCRIAIERPQLHQRKGRPYRVRIDMRVPPGHEIVVTRESSAGSIHDDLRTVLGDAFDAARRQLQGLSERQRGEIKSHPAQEYQGLVTRIFSEEGYGFLRDLEGREVYFHRNSVLRDEFDRLGVGSVVRLVAEEGEEGLQASTVELVEGAPSEGEGRSGMDLDAGPLGGEP